MIWKRYTLMEMPKYICLFLVLFFLACSNVPERTEASHRNIPINERKPDFFEPYLKKHPSAENHRVAALVWYSRRERNSTKLKGHTKALIRTNPSSKFIFSENAWLLLTDDVYSKELALLLEKKISEGVQNYQTHWMLAEIYSVQSIPPIRGRNEEEKAKFLKWYGLPDNTILISNINPNLLARASKHFRQAIKFARKDKPSLISSYIIEYCQFLYKAEKADEALKLLEVELSRLKSLKPNSNYPEVIIEINTEKIKNLIKKIKSGVDATEKV